MSNDDPAVAVVVVVPLVIIAVPVRTNVNTVRTDAKLHGVCRRYRARAQGDQCGQRQDNALHMHVLSESCSLIGERSAPDFVPNLHGGAASKLNASQQIFVPIGCHRAMELAAAWPLTWFELFHAAAIQIGFPARHRRRPSDKLQWDLPARPSANR